VKHLSYRYKVPLTLSVVIVFAVTIVSAILAWQSYRDLRRDLVAGAESLGRTLSRALAPVMLRDELWQAYEILATPLERDDVETRSEKTITVVSAGGAVYVSSHPALFPTLAPLAQMNPRYAALVEAAPEKDRSGPTSLEDDEAGRIVVAVPVLADDGTQLGAVLLTYSESIFLPRFYATVERVALSTLLVLAILVPIGWWIGRRMAVPLVRLADAMGRVGAAPGGDLTRGLFRGGDEIGQLGREFERMVGELDQKRALEKQMIAADRLAALGRLTAGIAHEINNPLGGMMNAINTFRHHARPDPVAARTMSLLERGLSQIRDTVSALLVEARLEAHALTRDDVEDIRMLIQPQAEEKSVALGWKNAVTEPLPLPSTQVRQILINLLLNAVHAAAESGRVDCNIGRQDGSLVLDVRNDGELIPAVQLEHLFEPFAAPGESGNGLGLWVTYQIVEQLKGSISVRSEAPDTSFTIRLPLMVHA
jgi:two-component system, NtrC family, sensor kinase